MSHAKRMLEEQMAEIDPDEADREIDGELFEKAMWDDPETAARLDRQREIRRAVDEWLAENARHRNEP